LLAQLAHSCAATTTVWRLRQPPYRPESQHAPKDYTKGFQGQQTVGFEVDAVLPDGRRRPVASAEKVNLKPDRRRKKNQKYAYLCSLDPNGRFRITMNVVTGQISFGVRVGKYYFTETLSPDKFMKIEAARSCYISRTDHLARKSYSNSEHFRIGLDFYQKEFLTKIRVQKKAYKLHMINLRRRRQKAHRQRRRHSSSKRQGD
jgi:hypothetical protein